MTSERALEELAPIVPTERAVAYERWLRDRSVESDSYLFSDARVRFDPRDEDIVVPARGLCVHGRGKGSTLESPGFTWDAPSVEPAKLARFLELLDGSHTLADARRAAGLPSRDAAALLAAAFGVVLFAPLAVAALERAVPAAEIVRFPGSPYEVVRAYWSNMAAARRLVPELEAAAVQGPSLAMTELRRLHAVVLLGGDAASFYRPASPIAKKGVAPGMLWHTPARTEETPSGTRFLEGPRVNASLLGGPAYGSLLAELLGDPEAALSTRRLRDDAGLDWGVVVNARADGDDAAKPWFCPPRPLLARHVTSLFQHVLAAQTATERGESQAAVAELARFHQKLVRLHPFRAANQSLAMCIVNASLAKLFGAGIPHLILDHLALRLLPDAYTRVFSLARAGWTAHGSPAERLGALGDKKRRAFALIERLRVAADLDETRALARANPVDARLALLDL